MDSSVEKQVRELSDSDIRQLFKYEPTPFELLPTGGSYPFLISEHSTTVDRFIVTESKYPPIEELEVPSTTSKEQDGTSLLPEGTTARAAAFPDGEMVQLETAAEVGDENSFIKAYKAIEWQERPPQDFARAIRLAIQGGAHLVARELAMTGADHYPNHEELQKMARILAPPVVKVASGNANTSWKNNRAWLGEHWNEYQGKWVALLDGQLLGVADTFDDLVVQVGDLKNSGILVTAVG